MPDIFLESLLEPARRYVLEAGEIIKKASLKPKNVRHKGRIDLVTDTDLAVEDFLKKRLIDLYPEASFLAEEGSPEASLGAAAWILDPVDGTTNFAHGLPFVATSLALWQQGRVCLGIVNLPMLGECFWALRGRGAFLNGRPLRVSEESEPENALLATGFPYDIRERMPVVLRRLENALRVCRGVRRCGAAAMDLAYLAAGRFDVFYEEGLQPWDLAAGSLLISEAGGKLTSLEGGEFSLFGGTVLAANAALHARILELIRL